MSIIMITFFLMFSFVSKCISTYNNLVDMEEEAKLAKANVEDAMQRRLELIPDLTETVKASVEHKEKVYEDIANAEATLESVLGGDVEEISEANNEVSKQINELLSTLKDYPEVTADKEFTRLMDEIEGSINRISRRREQYNEQVSEYNKVVRKFPGFILSGIFGFEEMEQFEADEEAEKTSLVDWSNSES